MELFHLITGNFGPTLLELPGGSAEILGLQIKRDPGCVCWVYVGDEISYPVKCGDYFINPRTQMTPVLIGKCLVLGILTFKNRGHWSSRTIIRIPIKQPG